MPGGSEEGAACIPITCRGAEEECEGAEPGERMSLGRVVTEVSISHFFMARCDEVSLSFLAEGTVFQII